MLCFPSGSKSLPGLHAHWQSSERYMLYMLERLRPRSMPQISVCGLELWPEARKCEDDWRLGQGILFGTVLMGWTLYIGI